MARCCRWAPRVSRWFPRRGIRSKVLATSSTVVPYSPAIPFSCRVSPVPVRLGLRENLSQFAVLVVINAFVGAMVGLERTLLPLIAERDFGLVSGTAVLSFLVSFGITKAIANLLARHLADRVGR